MSLLSNRREFLVRFGISAAAANFVLSLPSFGWAASTRRKQRLVFLVQPQRRYPKTLLAGSGRSRL